MANNTEAYCPNCQKRTDHYAQTGGWRCDECDAFNENISVNPYYKD